MVRIILEGSVDADLIPAEEQIRLMFADQYYMLQVRDETERRISLEDYQNDASLKGEFVRLLLNDGSLTEEERMQIAVCGIQALKGE